MEEGHRQGPAAKDVSSLALSLTLLSGITAEIQSAPLYQDPQVGPTFLNTCTCLWHLFGRPRLLGDVLQLV